jgi:trimeric autotransporter adhesin
MITFTKNSATIVKTTAAGLLLAVLIAAFLLAPKSAYASTTFTVTNTNDSGPGSLREAINGANNTQGADTINFEISGGGVKTIAPDTELPTISDTVSINGYSQPEAQPNTRATGGDAVLKVELSGANAASGTGLFITAPNSTVKGLAINRWTFGIRIDGADATGNKIAGNYLGTDATGTQDLGNGYSGVFIYDAPGNVIGGADAAGRNVISGNEQYGVSMNGQATVDNRIVGNYIGTDSTGTTDLGNQYFGVIAFQASNNTVGGTTAAERNIISGNSVNGVHLSGAFTTGNKVLGNFIGADKNGAPVLGNSANGAYISGPGNTVGGTSAAARNVVSGNAGSGISIVGNEATGNRILGNSTFSNGGLGIDLNDDGPTANDAGDADTGPNDLQNKPVLSSAKKSATGTTAVRGKLNSTPDKTFRVQLFSNPSGNEGKMLLGTQSITTDGSGKVSFTFSTKKQIELGQNITATATGPGGNTSEFSAPKQVVAS